MWGDPLSFLSDQTPTREKVILSDAEETPTLDPTMLVRLRIKACRLDRAFNERPEALPDESIVPCLSSELAGNPKFAQVRVAVGSNALFFQADIQGKRQLPWCRDSRLEDSDGLHIWIDTRHSREVQRATKYCHRYGFLPMGRGPKADLPYAGWAPINRARETSPQPPDDLLAIRARVADGRYRLIAAVHFDALHGIDVSDFPVIGCYFCILDRELGWQSLSMQPDMSSTENPSLWSELIIGS
jgi:hypothetical protein